MKYRWIMIIVFVIALSVPAHWSTVFSGDHDDGISKFTDDSISANDKVGKPDTNINFIVLKSMSDAKKKQKQGDSTSNFNDGSGDQNENSVVVGPGTQTGDIYNINVQK